MDVAAAMLPRVYETERTRENISYQKVNLTRSDVFEEGIDSQHLLRINQSYNLNLIPIVILIC